MLMKKFDVFELSEFDVPQSGHERVLTFVMSFSSEARALEWLAQRDKEHKKLGIIFTEHYYIVPQYKLQKEG